MLIGNCEKGGKSIYLSGAMPSIITPYSGVEFINQPITGPSFIVLTTLRRQWLIVALAWAGVWLAFYAALRPVWPASGRWLALSGLVLGYVLWVLWRNLSANHRPGESELLPALGPGNALTLVRGLCIGLLGGFLFGSWPVGALAWVIVLLYTVTDIADLLDGYLARRANHVTELGGVLDIEYDGLGTLVVILLAISFGQLP